MSDKSNPALLLQDYSFPAQELAKLSFCNSNKSAKVIEWANKLKTTQVSQTSATFYQCLPELARLKVSYKTRKEMLEELRPRVQYCATGLSKEFLYQPVRLPAAAQKAAVIAQALQKQLLDGYMIALRDCLGKDEAKPTVFDDLALLLHRAMSSVNLILFRGFQLYTKPPVKLWGLLHSLYKIAYFYDLNNRPINDDTLSSRRASTIDQTYIRTLLLAASNTSQLNQTDISSVHKALEIWSEQVTLNQKPSANSANVLIINVDDNTGAIHKSRFNGKRTDTLLEIDSTKIINFLSNENRPEPSLGGSTSPVKISLSIFLTQHLLASWGSTAKRASDRRAVNATADICVGLSDCHKAIAQGEDFKAFVAHNTNTDGSELNAFNTGFTPGSQFDTQAPSKVDTFKGSIINASQSGYCVLWREDIPTRVQAGEVILIRETGRIQWSLAVIRWIKQLKSASQIGIQVLAQHPRAAAISQVYDAGGESDFMRAIAVSTTLHGRSVNTIITAAAPFEEGGQAKLLSGDLTTPIKLTTCVFATSNVLQFAYKQLDFADK